MVRLLPRTLSLCLFSLAALAAVSTACAAGGQLAPATTDNASRGYRFEKGGWTYVHLEGDPRQMGFQHGSLLAAEIEDMVRVIKLENTHATGRDWEFFRESGRKALWPHIDAEYQQELEGIARGVQSKGVKLDLWDIVALNGGIELPQYYLPWLNNRQHAANTPHIAPEGRCSAFIATGSYTRGGKIVIAHNNWSSYLRHSASPRPPHPDGRRAGCDHQPGRLRRERCRVDDYRDDHYAV
jgi:hypothetical protein